MTSPTTEIDRPRMPAEDDGLQPVLSVEGMGVRYRARAGFVEAVSGVSLELRPGETLALVGESGCGKSTLARALMGLLAAAEGDVETTGSALFSPRDRSAKPSEMCPICARARCVHQPRKSIELLRANERTMRDIRGNTMSMVFQDPGKALNPTLTIRDQFAEVFTEHRGAEMFAELGAVANDPLRVVRRAANGRSRFGDSTLRRLPPWRRLHSRLVAELDDRITSALDTTRIPQPRRLLDRYPHELSGGMKQRVMIAMALACRPDLLIADEPTTALDVTTQARILDLIGELQDELDVAVLYISHDLSVVRAVSHRVAVMYAGHVVEVAATEDLFDAPVHPYTQGLLAASVSVSHGRGALKAIEGTVPELLEPARSCRFSPRCSKVHAPCEVAVPPLEPTMQAAHSAACFLIVEQPQTAEPAQPEGAV